jgi:hypothetical protein
LHDLAKEQKVAPMVVECINCEYFCHEGDANLPFDAELSNVLWFEDGSGISIASLVEYKFECKLE